MKKIIAGLALLLMSAACFADPPPLVVNNKITTPDYISVSNYMLSTGIANGQSGTVTKSQMSHWTPSGDAYYLGFYCSYNGVQLLGQINIDYNINTGTRMANGQCVSNDGTLFFAPEWDGNPASPVNIVSQTPPLKK